MTEILEAWSQCGEAHCKTQLGRGTRHVGFSHRWPRLAETASVWKAGGPCFLGIPIDLLVCGCLLELMDTVGTDGLVDLSTRAVAGPAFGTEAVISTQSEAPAHSSLAPASCIIWECSVIAICILF